MTRRHAFLDAGRAGRQRQRRLGDEVLGIGLELGAKHRDHCLVGLRADQHAIAARAVDLLDHEIVEMIEDVGQVFRLPAPPRRHVLQDGLLAEKEFHDLRHVAVDRLVVGDTGADRIGERQVAGLVDCHQAGHAQRRIRTEGQWIEEVVVDPPVDDVDALEPFGGAHIGDLAFNDHVATFNQLDTELVGEERVLVIGRVVDAGREQRDRRIGGSGLGRHRFQGGEQFVRVVLDRRHAMAREQLREQPHHDLAVLQHVGDAGRCARIVLQNIEGVGVDPHDIDAGDMNVDVVGNAKPVHFRTEDRVLEYEILRHDAGAQYLAAPVDILDVEVDRLNALLKAGAQRGPFGGRDDARQHVEGNQPFGRVRFAVDREGDADAPKQEFCLATAMVENVGGQIAQPFVETGIDRSHPAVGFSHFVECCCHSRLGGSVIDSRAPLNLINVASFTPKARDLLAKGAYGASGVRIPSVDPRRPGRD